MAKHSCEQMESAEESKVQSVSTSPLAKLQSEEVGQDVCLRYYHMTLVCVRVLNTRSSARV